VFGVVRPHRSRCRTVRDAVYPQGASLHFSSSSTTSCADVRMGVRGNASVVIERITSRTRGVCSAPVLDSYRGSLSVTWNVASPPTTNERGTAGEWFEFEACCGAMAMTGASSYDVKRFLVSYYAYPSTSLVATRKYVPPHLPRGQGSFRALERQLRLA
jgi:hypothetical protein